MENGDGLQDAARGGFSPSSTYYADRNAKYYFRAANGDYLAANERDVARRLRALGLASSVDFKRGEKVSEVEEQLMEIQERNRVDYAAPIAGYRRGLLERGSDRILITQELKLLRPERGAWPTVRATLEGLFNGRGEDGRVTVEQLPYVLGWLAIAMDGLYSGRPNKGQALIVAGEPNCGKTLFLSILEHMFGGRIGKPYSFMVGDTRFNDELFETSLLAIDDEADKTDIRSRRHLVAELKKIVAGRGSRCEGKGAKALNLDPHWRVVMLSNLEQDNLRVLPPLDSDVIDKLILLKGHKAAFAMPTGTVSEQRAFMGRMVEELPAFVHYLLHEHVIPEEYREDRFGVYPYLNSEIVAHMDNVTPWAELLLTLEREALAKEAIMVDTSTGIIKRLRDRSSWLTAKEKERYNPTAVGRMMADIAKKRPHRCWQTRSSSGADRLWVLLRADLRRDEVEADVEAKIEDFERYAGSNTEAEDRF